MTEAERKKKFWEKYGVGIVFSALILIVSAIILIKILATKIEEQKYIPVGVSSSDLIGDHYEDVVDTLEKAGFSSVWSDSDYTLGIDQIDEEYLVYEVQIGDDYSFEADASYRYDTEIMVRHRMLEYKTVPVSAEEFKGQNYESVIDTLEEAGFANITVEANYDVYIGLFAKDGEVDSVIINGNAEFEEGSRYRPDAEVVITYHSYVKNKPE